jgi:hypothetical protein
MIVARRQAHIAAVSAKTRLAVELWGSADTNMQKTYKTKT